MASTAGFCINRRARPWQPPLPPRNPTRSAIFHPGAVGSRRRSTAKARSRSERPSGPCFPLPCCLRFLVGTPARVAYQRAQCLLVNLLKFLTILGFRPFFKDFSLDP